MLEEADRPIADADNLIKAKQKMLQFVTKKPISELLENPEDETNKELLKQPQVKAIQKDINTLKEQKDQLLQKRESDIDNKVYRNGVFIVNVRQNVFYQSTGLSIVQLIPNTFLVAIKNE